MAYCIILGGLLTSFHNYCLLIFCKKSLKIWGKVKPSLENSWDLKICVLGKTFVSQGAMHEQTEISFLEIFGEN